MRLDEIELGRWGERIGSTIRSPVFICLEGQLGAGKSALARAIGRGAGVDVAMPSPSYNLLLRYPASSDREVVHIDLYRLDSPDELWELGWSQLGADSEIVLVEWADRAGSLLPRDRWVVRLSIPPHEALLRDIQVERIGEPPDLTGFPMSVFVKE